MKQTIIAFFFILKF